MEKGNGVQRYCTRHGVTMNGTENDNHRNYVLYNNSPTTTTINLDNLSLVLLQKRIDNHIIYIYMRIITFPLPGEAWLVYCW